MKTRRSRKAVINGTLSVYQYGGHVVDGRPIRTVINENRFGRPSIAESMSPIYTALENMGMDFRTGDAVTITIAITPRKAKRGKK
jgi:hypothetical protein